MLGLESKASVAEWVDATDLKSVIDIDVWVRVPPLAPIGNEYKRG